MRIAFKDASSKFEDLLKKAASVTIHQRNLQLLATEIYKTKYYLNPKFMGEIWAYGIMTITYTGHKLWRSLPLEIRVSYLDRI